MRRGLVAFYIDEGGTVKVKVNLQDLSPGQIPALITVMECLRDDLKEKFKRSIKKDEI